MQIQITPELLVQFKDRMKLTDDEDVNLTRILNASIVDLTEKCGTHDIYDDERFKELVFERSRYVYNDALEFFDTNFQTQITTLALSKALLTSFNGGENDEG